MKNLLDLTGRLKKAQPGGDLTQQVQGDAPVVDMVEKRQEILQRERREVKRTILTEFIGAFVVVPGRGLAKVSLFDISENGLAFDMEIDKGRFAQGEEVAMRVYLNQFTYFPFYARVENIRLIGEDGVFRHGVSLMKDSVNDQALYHFVKFIETVSAALKKDEGDVMVSNLSR